MADDNNRLYYYDGEWRTYDDLHENYGITASPSTPVTLYDSSLNEYPGWVDTSDNTTWIVQDNKWYTDNDIPYWTKLHKANIYLIDRNLNLYEYSLRESITYPHNGQLQSFQYMHLGFGITLTPSEIYYIKDGVIKCWYNKDIDKYWDVDTTQWYDNPPDYESGSGSGGSGGCDCNCDCNGGINPDINNINQIGAISIFALEKEDNIEITLGTNVDGSLLKPVCLNFEFSGETSCSDISSDQPIGMWKLLSAASKSATRCIVLAIKVSDDTPSTPIVPDITNLDQIGATGMFLLSKANSDELIYGTLIDSSRLSPVSITFNEQGELSYTVVELDSPITGLWRLFTTAVRNSNQCIVIARKTS